LPLAVQELQMGGTSIPQHLYNKALRAIPISYPGIAMLTAGNGSRLKRAPRRARKTA
jgi:hypothetical protein